MFCFPSLHPEIEKPTEFKVAFGDFIRTFEFAPGDGVELPIVQPGDALPFTTSTITPVNVVYEEAQAAVIVPKGKYWVRWLINPPQGSSVSLTINGQEPLTSTGFPFTRQIKDISSSYIQAQYIIDAPLQRNSIQIINSGSTLFTLGDIPNTRIGDTTILAQLTLVKIDTSLTPRDIIKCTTCPSNTLP